MESMKGHQGDVFFSQIQSIPAGFIKVENKPLAIGSSNHAHAITGDVERYEKNNRVVYKLKSSAALQHTDASLLTEQAYKSPQLLPVKDHNPHILSPGIYEFWIQKTYNPYTKLMEQVID